MKTMKVKLVGIDDWNRPVFKSIDSRDYFGSVNILFGYEATPEEVLSKVTVKDLEYFGTSFGCEPLGGMPADLTLEIVN